MTASDGDEPRLLTGLVGRGILSSRSPWMHEQESKAQGFGLDYSLFDFSDRGWEDCYLPTLLEEVQSKGFSGVNITYPFKQMVIPFLDSLSEAAERVGAVNTVSFADGRRIGHNTDVTGFAESVRSGLAGADRSAVLQLGCGGAGAATAHALLQGETDRLYLYDVDTAKCEMLAAGLNDMYGSGSAIGLSELQEACLDVAGIVNATPIGMDKHPGMALPEAFIEARHWIADIIYFPIETKFLSVARAKGCRILDGSGMAIHQAARVFEIFTGRAPNIERMAKSFRQFGTVAADPI